MVAKCSYGKYHPGRGTFTYIYLGMHINTKNDYWWALACQDGKRSHLQSNNLAGSGADSCLLGGEEFSLCLEVRGESLVSVTFVLFFLLSWFSLSLSWLSINSFSMAAWNSWADICKVRQKQYASNFSLGVCSPFTPWLPWSSDGQSWSIKDVLQKNFTEINHVD